ncbi:MAG: inositol monophosphatase [Alphaproteobacteria bacterium]|nr:inositol monophosphatase [Alphaproteobacteria bacterium]
MAVRSPNLNVMIRAVEKAGRSLIRDFGEVENLQVSVKGPADFVSAADKRSEEILHEELSKARPDFSFLMEESGEVKGTDEEHRFIIDPLDGTFNFLHGIPHWCISVALEKGDEIIAAVVYNPVTDELFTAEKGGGAFLRHRRLRVSNRRKPNEMLIACGHPGRHKDHFDAFYAEMRMVSSTFPAIRRLGAAALDMAYVAAGRADAFWERFINPWDIAAGYLIVKEAGGFTKDYMDNKENPIYSGNVLCGHEFAMTELQGLLKKAHSA